MIITTARLDRWAHPLPRPVKTTRGAITRRRGLCLTLIDEADRRGTGEASPLPGFSAETLDDATAQLAALTGPGGPLIGQGLAGVEDIDRLLSETWAPSVRHAVEQALLSLLGARRGCSLAALLGAKTHTEVRSHQLITDPEHAAGRSSLKLKVGAEGPEDLVRRVRAVRAVAPDADLRIDANQAWSAADAVAHLRALEPVGVELVEEPLADPTPRALADLRALTTIPLAADESCRTPAALEALITAGAVDVVVLKPMLIGGLRRSVAMAHRAAAAGLGVMVTTSFDSPCGHRAAVAVARACPVEALRTCGLDPATSVARAPTPEAPTPPVTIAGIPSPVAAAARARPDHPAIDDLTWRVVADRAARWATRLARHGVCEGDSVALLGERSREWAVALHGIGWLGAVAAPIAADTPAAARFGLLETLQPTLVVADDPLSVPPGPWLTLALRADPRDEHAPAPEPTWSLGAPRVKIATSGTTGAPSWVTLATHQLAFAAMGSAARLGHALGDRWLNCLPLHHVGGLSILLRTAWLATTCELAPPGRFDADAVAQALDAGHVTMVSLVPTMLERALDARAERPFPPSLRVVLVGGAPTPDALRARCVALSVPVATTWGMTEAAAQVATSLPGELGPAGSVGPPLPFAQVDQRPDGRLLVRGPQVSMPAGLVTSDLGAVDPTGRVRVSGRADRVLLRGGENVWPSAIEATLVRHPAIAAAYVIGLAHPTLGEVPAAALVPETSSVTPTRDQLDTWLAGQLSRHAVPVAMRWLPELPRTALGKVSGAAVRALFDGDQVEAGQGLHEARGHGQLAEAVEVDERVHEANGRPQLSALGAPHGVLEGQRGAADARDLQGHGEAIAHAHGARVVRLGVHQRHAPAALVEDLPQREPGGHEHLLVGRVAVLEDLPEKRDARAIDVLEANRDDVLEGHAGRSLWVAAEDAR